MLEQMRSKSHTWPEEVRMFCLVLGSMLAVVSSL